MTNALQPCQAEWRPTHFGWLSLSAPLSSHHTLKMSSLATSAAAVSSFIHGTHLHKRSPSKFSWKLPWLYNKVKITSKSLVFRVDNTWDFLRHLPDLNPEATLKMQVAVSQVLRFQVRRSVLRKCHCVCWQHGLFLRSFNCKTVLDFYVFFWGGDTCFQKKETTSK